MNPDKSTRYCVLFVSRKTPRIRGQIVKKVKGDSGIAVPGGYIPAPSALPVERIAHGRFLCASCRPEPVRVQARSGYPVEKEVFRQSQGAANRPPLACIQFGSLLRKIPQRRPYRRHHEGREGAFLAPDGLLHPLDHVIGKSDALGGGFGNHRNFKLIHFLTFCPSQRGEVLPSPSLFRKAG